MFLHVAPIRGVQLGHIEVTQCLLAVKPRHLERAVDDMSVAILLEQHHCRLPRVGNAGDYLHARRFVR